eukprot:35631_1
MSKRSLHGQWLNKCRNILIAMETKNIRQRALSWTEIVNAETTKINGILAINLSNYRSSNPNTDLSFNYSVDRPLQYLTFLSEWNGIKTRNIATQPSSYNEFEQKAKNWLNGRRAPNYGNTLFPEMIKASYTYSNKLSLLVFGNVPMNTLSTAPRGDSLQNLYHKTLLFAYLTKLCSERIAVHQNWKKTNLLCENSVKNIHSNTAKLLQQYAIHDYTKNDLNSFPGSLQRSAAFFEEQHNQYLSRLARAYNALKNGTNQHTNTNNRNHVHPGYNQAAPPPCHVNYVAIKSSEYDVIMQRLTALEYKHNDQANQISTLTAKCQFLQSHIEANTIPSNPSLASVPHFDNKLAANDRNDVYYNGPFDRSGLIGTRTNTTSSPSIAPSCNDTRSTTTHSNHMTIPMPIPMPFAAPVPNIPPITSLPPQIDIPSFTSSSLVISDITSNANTYSAPDMERKVNVSYDQSGNSNSVPMSMNNNNNYSTYNCDDYGLSLQSDHKVPQMPDDFMSSFTPTSNSFRDHIMFDHPNSTPNNTQLFCYPTLEY